MSKISQIYHDYLKTNIHLWKYKFESSLSTSLPEPSTPEYEKEKSVESDEVLEIIDI